MPDLNERTLGQLDLRIATILEAERVPKTDRLLKLQVRMGEEVRQLVAGIGASYDPQDLAGKQVIVVANLEPATIRGVESRGMLLAASGETGVVLLGPETEVPDGTRVE